METQRRPVHSCAALGGREAVRELFTTLSRKRSQLRVGRHMVDMLSRSSNCCCKGTLAHVRAALAEPPDAPARRVLLLIIPSCFKMAVASTVQQVWSYEGVVLAYFTI
jgi:hypothetical protein